MALSRSLRSQMLQLDARRAEVTQVQSPTLRMMMASPEERRVNDALGGLSFLGGETGGGTPDTGGTAFAPEISSLGTLMLADTGGAEAPPAAGVGDGLTDPGMFGAIDPGQEGITSPAGARGAALQAAVNPVGGDPSDAGGGGSVAGGSMADVSPQDVASFGKIGVGPLSTNALSLGSKVAGLAGSPLAAAALGLPGLALSAFQTAVGTAGKIANAMGVNTANSLAQGQGGINDPDPNEAAQALDANSGLAAALSSAPPGTAVSLTGHQAGLASNAMLDGVAPDSVHSDPEGIGLGATAPGGYVTMQPTQHSLNNSPTANVGPAQAGVAEGLVQLVSDLAVALGIRGGAPDDAPNLSEGGVPGSPGLAGLGIGGGSTGGEDGGGGPGGNSGAPSGGGDSGNPGDFLRGGVVGRDQRAGKSTRIDAHEDEYVVRAEPSKKYRRLLEAINQDRPQQVSQLARAMAG